MRSVPPTAGPTGAGGAGERARARPTGRPRTPTPDVTIPPRASSGAASGAARVRRRDRRGRGIRGPLLPPSAPANRTRRERFDENVLTVIERIERSWARELRGTEFAVEEVPPSDPAPWEDGTVPLSRAFPAAAGQPARIIVYRRPVEARAIDAEDLLDLLRDVLVEQVAGLLARTPEEIDPDYQGGD